MNETGHHDFFIHKQDVARLEEIIKKTDIYK